MNFDTLTTLPFAKRYQAQRYPLPSIVALIQAQDDGRFLLIKRIKEPYTGKWALVGGKWEFGETVAQCAIREVHEETGLKTDFIALRGIMMERITPHALETGGHFLLFVCAVLKTEGVAEAQDEGDVAWFTLDELQALHTAEAIVPSDFLLIQEFATSTQTLPYIEADMIGGTTPVLQRYETLQ